MENKKQTIIIWILLITIAIMGSYIIANNKSTQTFVEAKNNESQNYEKVETKQTQPKQIEAKEYIFESGNYTSGLDFEEGIYTITALEGKGNVRSTNGSYNGGIGAMMGADEDEYYKKEYKNIKLPKNCELRIEKVKIKITKVR